MSETMEYRGYVGTINKDDSDGVFYGKLGGIRDLVLYEGDTREELEASFKEAVDEFIADGGPSGPLDAERVCSAN